MRADVAYVVQLRSDPIAQKIARDSGFEFPLSALEAAGLTIRLERMQDVANTIVTYGETKPEDWAGLIASSSTGTVVAQFKDHLDVHRQAIELLLLPNANYQLRRVSWSTKELDALVAKVVEDKDWLESVGAKLDGYGVDEARNVALIDVLSLDPSIDDQIIEHFDAQGRMKVRVSDLLPWDGGWAEVQVTVALSSRPVGPDLICRVSSDTPFTYPQWVPVAHSGSCAFVLEATSHVVEVVKTSDAGEEVIARRNISVVNGINQSITIRVDDD